jgi:hypothetical protein
MPIQSASDSQKVDYLWKKIVYGAAKTDIAANIDATNEPNPSPLQIRADKILQDSASIPSVIPVSNSSVVTVAPTTFPVECTSTAGIPTPVLTWQTGRTFWVPPEFGSTYQIKVYIAPSGNAANVASKGTQVFATGSGNNDLWVFDYQSGILNFNSNNTPYNASNQPISFTGNSVYISGAVYSGNLGLPTASNIGNAILGNITFNGDTISSKNANGNIILSAPGTGIVQVTGVDAFGLPAGTQGDRPSNPVVGYTRFSTTSGQIEYYDGTNWISPGQATISSDVIAPDGVSNTYPLSANTTSSGILVSINGTIQQPVYSYNIINNNQIQFTETPLTSDVVEVRLMAPSAVSVGSLRFNNYTSVILDTENINMVGNIQTTGFYNNKANTLIPNVATTTIDSYSTTSYRTVKYVIQAVRASDVQSSETLVTHNGTVVGATTYGVLVLGNALGNISATIIGSNVQVQFSPTTANTYLTVSRDFYPL